MRVFKTIVKNENGEVENTEDYIAVLETKQDRLIYKHRYYYMLLDSYERLDGDRMNDDDIVRYFDYSDVDNRVLEAGTELVDDDGYRYVIEKEIERTYSQYNLSELVEEAVDYMNEMFANVDEGFDKADALKIFYDEYREDFEQELC